MGKVRLFIGGDLCLCGPAKGAFPPVEADIRVLNLEGPVTKQGRKPNTKAGINLNLRQHDDIVNILTRNRWDVALLANNHITDFGREGLADTVAFLDEKGIAHLGAGISHKAAYEPLIIAKNGVKIGLVNGAEGQTGCMKSTESPYGYAWILHPEITKSIARLRSECDLVIVFPHAGLEFFDLPLPEWREIYRSLIDAGADAVVATHTHVIQGKEGYKGKPIYYSLGNFFFDLPSARDPEWNNGMCVTITFNTDTKELNTTETFFSFSGEGMNLQPALAEKFAERSAIFAEGRKAEYISRVNERCRTLWHTHYKPMFACCPLALLKRVRRMIIKRSTKDGDALLYNLMSTESHRFVIERALREKLA